MSYNELREHKKGDKIKWIFTFIAILLCFVMIVGICLQVFGTGNQKPSEWFKQTETEDSETKSDNNVVLSTGETQGMRLMSIYVAEEDYEEYGISAQSAENVYSLSVTYTPANTTFQETTYTIAFKNASSTWAMGKTVTDYATVTQSAVGSKDAILTVLKPFSEQIIVTATNNRNTSVKATTTVDYVCTTLNIGISSAMNSVGDGIITTYSGWSYGTVTPVTTGNVTFLFDVGQAFVSEATSAGFTVDRFYTETINVPETEIDNEPVLSSIQGIYRSIAGYTTMTQEEKSSYDLFLGSLFASYDDGDGCGLYAFSYNRVYGGFDYGGFDAMDDLSLDTWFDYDRGTDWSDNFEVSATGMTSNTSSIVAG